MFFLRQMLPGKPGQSATVLVVDDDVAIRRLLERALAQDGCAVLCAQDGVEALEISRKHQGPIHLLLSDIVMPRMDGITLCGRIGQERPDTLVMLISGQCDETILPPRIDFLRKPFTLDALRLRVRRILNLSRGAEGRV